MQLDWQNAVVVALVAAAGAYLARVAWQAISRRRAGSCGGCGTCPANAPEPEVVELGRSAAPAAHNGRPSPPADGA